MANGTTEFISASGRRVGPAEISHAQEVVKLFPRLSRKELARTLCEHWGWFGPGGSAEVRACTKVLERLEREGVLRLPEKCESKVRRGGTESTIDTSDPLLEPSATISLALEQLRPVRLVTVEGFEQASLWKGFLARYHPQGYRRPFGRSLCYFIESDLGRLGCLLISSGARALEERDRWLGWSASQRLGNLAFVVNNSRFLLFPWVRVAHLASHVLGHLARQLGDDWSNRWGYRPVLLETFVDPSLYRGVCYRAAGWQAVGETKGEGLRLRGHSYQTNRKMILVRPLVRDFRSHLLRNPQPQRDLS